jgi:hypothetical protein
MPVIHLGVSDIPYTDGTQTTGDVAEILEDKYHVMQVFYEQHKEDVAADLESSLSGQLENMMAGSPPPNKPFGSAESAIEDRFRRFLSEAEMDKLGYPGVPTAAALAGVSHRLKIKKGSPRPSFIDTGLYESSMVCWVD